LRKSVPILPWSVLRARFLLVKRKEKVK